MGAHGVDRGVFGGGDIGGDVAEAVCRRAADLAGVWRSWFRPLQGRRSQEGAGKGRRLGPGWVGGANGVSPACSLPEGHAERPCHPRRHPRPRQPGGELLRLISCSLQCRSRQPAPSRRSPTPFSGRLPRPRPHSPLQGHSRAVPLVRRLQRPHAPRAARHLIRGGCAAAGPFEVQQLDGARGRRPQRDGALPGRRVGVHPQRGVCGRRRGRWSGPRGDGQSLGSEYLKSVQSG